jgi:hypothetical protein
MHDLDRTQVEYESGLHELESEFHELGHEGELGHESPLHEILHEAGLHEFHEGEMHEAEFHEGEVHEAGTHELGGHESGLSEAEEMELAGELLEVSNEAELEQFLGRLVRRAWRGVRRVASGIARPLGGVLRVVARRALPIVGGALGTAVGGPLGGMIGSKLAAGAGSLFGLELEGLSAEDREFEVARRYVRFATAAARRAALAPPGVTPAAAVRSAVVAAARRYAPGLLRRLAAGIDAGGAAPAYPTTTYVGTARRGTWFRRGRRIILIGV